MDFFKDTRVIFYVRRMVDLMKTAKENVYLMHIFGNIELLLAHLSQRRIGELIVYQ